MCNAKKDGNVLMYNTDFLHSSQIEKVQVLQGPKGINEELYLRNKETQQTLQVIVNIQYDASF